MPTYKVDPKGYCYDIVPAGERGWREDDIGVRLPVGDYVTQRRVS